MSTDCERTFSLAKLTVSSQRHSLLGSSIESIQLLKNWIRGGSVTLGGLCLSNKAVRSHGQNRGAGNRST
ncbi:transposase-like protein [Fusarium oxysporum f. sp. phaseoli]